MFKIYEFLDKLDDLQEKESCKASELVKMIIRENVGDVIDLLNKIPKFILKRYVDTDEIQKMLNEVREIEN